MKKSRKLTIIAAVVLVVGATSVTGFAASAYQGPAEAVAGITGQTVESVIAEKQETNKTYGKIAEEAGKLDEFKSEAMEIKKDRINARVAEGKITQERADEVIKNIEEHQVNCDGTAPERLGQKEGIGFGMNANGDGQGLANGKNGEGLGQGQGHGQGQGQGQGQGGMRLQDGSGAGQGK